VIAAAGARGQDPTMRAMAELPAGLLVAPEAAEAAALAMKLPALAIDRRRFGQRNVQLVTMAGAPLGQLMRARDLQPNRPYHRCSPALRRDISVSPRARPALIQLKRWWSYGTRYSAMDSLAPRAAAMQRPISFHRKICERGRPADENETVQ